MDAKIQARKMLSEHTTATAARIAAETALSFRRGTEGRAFWMQVTQAIEDVCAPAEEQTFPQFHSL